VATDPLPLLSRALDQMSDLLGRVRPEQRGNPTPCSSWDVAALARHVVFELERFEAAARLTQPDRRQAAGEIEGDWRVAFDRGAGTLLAAWQEAGDLDATVSLPVGEVPRSFVVSQQLTEYAVHAWDLALAIDHSGQLDEEIAAAALAFASRNLKPEHRGEGKAFGLQVSVADHAPATDRLAGFFGRDPHWKAT
jgi:uncharacterized protein (TIGR03086 family)